MQRLLQRSIPEDLTSVESLEDSNTFYYNKNGYTFEKLSHPEKDVKTADGVVDYLGDGQWTW